MRYGLLAIAFVSLATVLAVDRLPADGGSQGSHPSGFAIGDNPNPVIWGERSSSSHPTSSRSVSLFPPYGGFAYGYDSSFGYGCGLGYGSGYYSPGYYYPGHYYPAYPSYWLGPGLGPFNYPPVVVPSGMSYGPYASQRFLGLGNSSRGTTGVIPFKAQTDEDQNAEPPAANKALERGTNAKAIAAAGKYIGYGDALFAKQNWLAANERYRRAADNAPQFADAYFRQGFALAATSRYDLAVVAIKRGLKLNPKWPDSPFRLKELYGNNVAAQTTHLNAVAKAAEKSPQDPNPFFLVGVYLHFDGQTDRAEAFFHRALELAGDDAEHIRAFLPK